MTDLIIFTVKSNRYAVEISHVQRIIQATKLTDIPNAHPLIEGMMSYENKVIKIVNFRKMINLPTYDMELKELFGNLKMQHKAWIDALMQSVTKNTTFQKTTNPHHCDLGKWLDSFTSYDDHVSAILKELNAHHKLLHNSAIDILEILETDQEKAISMVETKVYEIYNHTMSAIDMFISEFDIVANSLQKLLLYYGDVDTFAIKVDSIVDIAHIDESMIKSSNEDNKVSEYLELKGVIELDGHLVNVIGSVSLPDHRH
jgi:chemotaxis signal transduction protein